MTQFTPTCALQITKWVAGRLKTLAYGTFNAGFELDDECLTNEEMTYELDEKWNERE